MSTPTDDVRLRLDISYDGTDFSGWAVQPGRRTVAGVLTEALRTLLRRESRLVVAGRTDAGVHATGQVAHVDVAVDRLMALIPRHLKNGRRVQPARRSQRHGPGPASLGAHDRQGLTRSAWFRCWWRPAGDWSVGWQGCCPSTCGSDQLVQRPMASTHAFPR